MDSIIIAVDFDGTLCEGDRWPEIGQPCIGVITYVKRRQEEGCKIILWTNRTGERLSEALEWSHNQGLDFDAVNENVPETLEWLQPESRKIFAHEYIDDRNNISWLKYR